MNERDVDTIADQLSRRLWIPDRQEVFLGRALLHRCERIEGESPPPGMPAVPPGGPPWLTQVLAGQAALARELETELLPVWSNILPGSRMLTLVESYSDALRPVVPIADRLVRAWSSSPPRGFSVATAARWAEQSHTTAAEAALQLTRMAVQHWEDRQLSAAALRSVNWAQERAEQVGLVLSAAVSARP